ncbi:MAG: asparaginase [Propionibacteriaceae bacterium]|jgi:L-asparaginase|nr:asparaginase [Propionibacteriaceae bacterium]
MRVHVLYTGGTIGMVESAAGLVPGADLAGWLDDLLRRTPWAERVAYSEFPRPIDSSNATPRDWQAIVDDLAGQRDAADAFVVLHGTDTMAYTSAALAFALTGFGRPVVVTGAQYPFSVAGSDAAANVLGALQAATSGRADGVTLFFGHHLLPGARAAKVSTWAFSGFESAGTAPLAVAGAPWRWNPAPPPGRGWPDPRPYGRHDVVVLDLCPGLTAARLGHLLEPRPEAVILRAFGVGNAPTDEPGLVGVIRDTVTAGVPVIVCSQCFEAQILLGRYAAGGALAAAGAVGAAGMTLEAAYAKTVFLLSQGLDGRAVGEWIGQNLAGELTEE